VLRVRVWHISEEPIGTEHVRSLDLSRHTQRGPERPELTHSGHRVAIQAVNARAWAQNLARYRMPSLGPRIVEILITVVPFLALGR
jgi:hypothetical protein